MLLAIILPSGVSFLDLDFNISVGVSHCIAFNNKTCLKLVGSVQGPHHSVESGRVVYRRDCYV